MKTGDASAQIPPVIPARLREASGFLARGSATCGASRIPERSRIPLTRPSATLSPSDGARGNTAAIIQTDVSDSLSPSEGERDGVRGIRGLWAAGIFLLVMAACWVLYHYNPSQYGFYPRCMFHTVTGLLCPGCGSQRALYQLVHGHLLTACRCNLLLMLVVAWVAFKGARHAMANWQGMPAPSWLPHSRRYLIWLAVAVILFSVLRNFPGAPFCYLAPP